MLAYGLVSTLLMALVQFIKKRSGANGLLILSGLSLLGGTIYALLVGVGLWEAVAAHTVVIMATANLIFNALNQILKTIDPDDANV